MNVIIDVTMATEIGEGVSAEVNKNLKDLHRVNRKSNSIIVLLLTSHLQVLSRQPFLQNVSFVASQGLLLIFH